jgi:hypothetical protein
VFIAKNLRYSLDSLAIDYAGSISYRCDGIESLSAISETFKGFVMF